MAVARREVATLAFAGLLAVLAIAVFLNWGVTATERVRAHFGIDANTAEAIRAGLLQKVELGTPRPRIVEFLERSGVGDDQKSRMESSPSEVRCAFYSDDLAYDCGAESGWNIDFEFDASDQLREITVRKELLRL